MKIYRRDDFKSDDFWAIFVPGYGPGETTEDVERRAQKRLEDSGVVPIAVTDVELHCGDTIRIGDKVYHVGMCGKYKCVVNDPVVIDDDPEEREYDDELHCPYCGAEIPDSFEFPKDGDERCIFCGSLFHFEKEMTVRWNSYPVEPAQVKDI